MHHNNLKKCVKRSSHLVTLTKKQKENFKIFHKNRNT